MPLKTEAIHKNAERLDVLASHEVLTILLNGHMEALACVHSAIAEIEAGATMMVNNIKQGGRLCYAAAGSSALMAMADGLELPGTFGIGNARITILLAGGVETLFDMLGSTEDHFAQAETDIKDVGLCAKDCLIAVSASGSTAYTIAALKGARRCGAATIAIVNNANCQMNRLADITILLETPAEIIAGSTRLGAATAQKAALNMMSTLMGIKLGHVHDGMMVNARADNAKLKRRAVGIVQRIANCDAQRAQSLLQVTDGSIKLAALLAAGSRDKAQAEVLLAKSGGMLRKALAQLSSNSLKYP